MTQWHGMSALGGITYSSYTQDSATWVLGLYAVCYDSSWAPGINGQLKMKFVFHIT